MATREQAIAALRRKGYTGPIPGEQSGQSQTAQAPMAQKSELERTLETLNASGLIKKPSPLRELASAGHTFFTGQPLPEQDDIGRDLAKTVATESIKNQFRDPLDEQIKQERLKTLKAGITTDAEGNIIRTSDAARDERESRLQDFESRRQAGNLRRELNENQYVKRFREMNSAASGIDSILSDTLSRTENTSKNIGDQALITLYNKILDPMSVVRESEYARTPQGLALLNRMQGFVQKVQAGGSGLTDADRIEVGRAAKILINNAGDLYNQRLTEAEETATAYRVPTDLVLSGFSRFSPYNIDQAYTNNQANQQVSNKTGQLSDDDAYQVYLDALKRK